jgi:serine/threonine protein kinase
MMRTIRAAHKKTTEEDGPIGKSIDSYRLVRRLGCGAMGAVYEVIHVNIGRRYALKLLHPHLNGNQQAVARFVSEGQTANQPAIDGVVAIHDVKRSSCGQTYILMEYLDGETLAVRIAKEFGRSDGLQRSHSGPDLRAVPRSSYVNVSLMLAKQIASTLEVIHRSGVVHRDKKMSVPRLTTKGHTDGETDHDYLRSPQHCQQDSASHTT